MLAVHEELDGAQLLLDVLGKVDRPLEGGEVELVAAFPCQDSRVFLVAQARPRVLVVEDGGYVGPEVLLNLSKKRLEFSGRIYVTLLSWTYLQVCVKLILTSLT